MPSHDDLQARVTELELRYSEQEDTIQQMSREVFELQQKVDLLVKQVRSLKQRLPLEPDDAPPRTLEDEKPPHY